MQLLQESQRMHCMRAGRHDRPRRDVQERYFLVMTRKALSDSGLVRSALVGLDGASKLFLTAMNSLLSSKSSAPTLMVRHIRSAMIGLRSASIALIECKLQ